MILNRVDLGLQTYANWYGKIARFNFSRNFADIGHLLRAEPASRHLRPDVQVAQPSLIQKGPAVRWSADRVRLRQCGYSWARFSDSSDLTSVNSAMSQCPDHTVCLPNMEEFVQMRNEELENCASNLPTQNANQTIHPEKGWLSWIYELGVLQFNSAQSICQPCPHYLWNSSHIRDQGGRDPLTSIHTSHKSCLNYVLTLLLIYVKSIENLNHFSTMT